MTLRNKSFRLFYASTVAAWFIACNTINAADASNDKQAPFIRVLQSDAAPGEKAVACKKLAIYGTKEAIPALAPLLIDKDLTSWARIALEAIPDPAADAALRDAVGKTQDRILVGIINSIGFRRDSKAVDLLISKLQDSNADVASAAAVALGRIGGSQAAKALTGQLQSAPDAVRTAVAEGCIVCAEQYMNQGNNAESVKIYNLVRQANVPKQKVCEAIRGAILSQKDAGIPLLLEILRSNDRLKQSIGLRVARELPGQKATKALAGELDKADAQHQVMLLLAIADRKDDGVLPVVLKAIQAGTPQLRSTAASVLEHMDAKASVPVLLDAAASSEAELSKTAKGVLVRLSAENLDNNILSRLSQSSGKKQQAYIELAERRQIKAALPTIVKCMSDTDSDVRNAAVKAMGTIGDAAQVADLAKSFSFATDTKDRTALERAIMALCGRCGAECEPHISPLLVSNDITQRIIGLHALSAIGGASALGKVKEAINGANEIIQDEAVRVLSTWANNWPDDPGLGESLLQLAQSSKKASHQLLGMRGYLEFLQSDKKLNDSEKVSKVKELLPLMNRAEEKQLAISTLSAISSNSSLELLVSLTADSTIVEEACSGITNLAGVKRTRLTKEQRQKALRVVVEKSKNSATLKKAEGLLKSL